MELDWTQFDTSLAFAAIKNNHERLRRFAKDSLSGAPGRDVRVGHLSSQREGPGDTASTLTRPPSCKYFIERLSKQHPSGNVHVLLSTLSTTNAHEDGLWC